MMRHGLTIVVLLLWCAPLSADAKGDWAKALERKVATLKIDLPALVPAKVGILVLTPDRGQFYAYARQTDRSPEQLLAKLNATSGTSWASGPNRAIDLVSLKAGATVTVHSVTITNERIVFRLWDEFARQKRTTTSWPDDPSTGFQIMLPVKVSKNFTERDVVDALVAQVLDWKN